MQALAGVLSTTTRTDLDWWRRAVGYEVYIRSFNDSDGDGVGDLRGVRQRLEHIAALGVDAVWLTPFFPSPGHDHGYDVSDYRDVDPALGTLEDWDDLVDHARSLGLRLLVDIVPNHTSSEHEWFREAINDPASPYRDYYVFADPAPDGGPPNNWVSHFGGPAWSLDPAGTGQYYCHLFLPEQPDLNWANPAVMDEFAGILQFWCERGASGFRIDVAHGLTKDPLLRSNPELRPVLPGMHPWDSFAAFEHIYDLHRSETATLFHRWREAVADHAAVLIGEMDTRDVHRFAEYVADQQGLHAGFVLQVGLSGWDPARIVDTLVAYQQHTNGGCAWEISNHDQARAVSRYGGGAVGLRRAEALTALMMCIDGIPFIYQGEELGLPDAVVIGGAHDPMSARNGDGMWSRDVSRGPMPWTASQPNRGFSTATSAWLPTEPVPVSLTAEAQRHDETSTFARYRRIVGLRRANPQLCSAPCHVVSSAGGVLILRRGTLLVVGNLSRESVTIDETHLGDNDDVASNLVFATTPAAARISGRHWTIDAESTAIIDIADGHGPHANRGHG